MKFRDAKSVFLPATIIFGSIACSLAFPTVEASGPDSIDGSASSEASSGSSSSGSNDAASETGVIDEDGAAPFTPGPSCNGLPTTCGGDRNCCTNEVVPEGTFKRTFDNVTATDPNNSATIAAYRLDVFEVTVGRFRKFLSATAAGDGQAMNGCNGHAWTDTAAANENLPINCIRWTDASSFCAWDGGRLPTEAEWNYAAAGGAEQRVYPWSIPATSTTIDPTRAIFGVGAPADVGLRNAGDGKWGHADLAGNVAEWALDFKNGNYINPCDNCAELSALSERIARGGGFDQNGDPLHVADRGSRDPNNRFANVGVRCARKL